MTHATRLLLHSCKLGPSTGRTVAHDRLRARRWASYISCQSYFCRITKFGGEDISESTAKLLYTAAKRLATESGDDGV